MDCENTDPVATLKPIETWTFGGKRFFAFSIGIQGGTGIVDENGLNYGSWNHLCEFRDRQKRGDEICQPIDPRPIQYFSIRY